MRLSLVARTHTCVTASHLLERQYESAILSCVKFLHVRNELLAQAAGTSGRVCVACSTDGAATWGATSHCMSVAVQEKAKKRPHGEGAKYSRTAARRRSRWASIRACCAKRRSSRCAAAQRRVLKQLLAGDTYLRQSASSHQVGHDEQLDEEKLQLRCKREQHCSCRAIPFSRRRPHRRGGYPISASIRIIYRIPG